tara:strand:- start:336 stop:524 length:189 start_codon:yes stop_codon:yes gene_type:complete
MSEELETAVEETTAESDERFIKVADLDAFMNQVSNMLMSIVAGINNTMDELKRSDPSDDNEN